MNLIEPLSLPEILFSHVYQAESYRNRFSPRAGYLEISYIAEGALEIAIGDQTYRAEAGELICFLHQAKTTVSAAAFHCHHTVGARMDWRFSKEEAALQLPTILPADPAACRIIDELIHRPLYYRTAKAAGAAKFLELLCAVDKACRRTQKSGLPSERLYAAQAKDFIQKNLQAPLTQAAVATHLRISPEYLCTVFKRTEGTTVMRYINRTKLENIKALMEHNNLRLYEAAALYGYADPNYVSRLFKQLFGYNITEKPRVHPTIK